jgi:hypothetical protein
VLELRVADLMGNGFDVLQYLLELIYIGLIKLKGGFQKKGWSGD